jgi:hypothetical protein
MNVLVMNKGQLRVAKRAQKDYTLAFKLQIVNEVEKGELAQHAAVGKYCKTMFGE